MLFLLIVQEGAVELLLRQVAVVRKPAGGGRQHQKQQGRARQAGEPIQQAAPDPPVLLHPAGLLHLAHRAAALPGAARTVLQHRERRRHQRRRRRQQWLINRVRDTTYNDEVYRSKRGRHA